jgi:dienelactone hydrolase family protein
VTGFCWGGSTVNFLAVALGPDQQAGVPFYAAAETASVPKIRAALLIHYAESGQRINEMWPAYEAALKAAGVTYQVNIYPRHPARLSQQLHPALPGSRGETGVGTHGGVLQDEPGLTICGTLNPPGGPDRDRHGGAPTR